MVMVGKLWLGGLRWIEVLSRYAGLISNDLRYMLVERTCVRN